MGLNASVMCNCYRDGKASPCPYPEHFQYDPATRPALELDYTSSEAQHEEFQRWLETACEHPGMNQASVYIASWKGYQAFADALEQMPADPFPLLRAELPDGGNGVTSPERARMMLKEIEAFNRLDKIADQAVLVDDERGQDISMGSNVLNGTLAMDRVTGFDLGFNADGFFVRDRFELNRLLFQARQVEQTVIHPESHQVEYSDRDEGARRFRCSTPFGKLITGDDGLPRPFFQQFSVHMRPVSPERFAYLTDPLQVVLQASVDTGNPVRWG